MSDRLHAPAPSVTAPRVHPTPPGRPTRRPAAASAGPRADPAPSPAPLEETLRVLRRRVVALMLVCALPGWGVAYRAARGVAGPDAPTAEAAAVASGGPAASGGAMLAILLVTASVALGLWLLRGLWRDLDAVATEVAAGRQLSRLLHMRTRERDRALRAKADLTRELQHDALTQLASRAVFLRRLDTALQRHAETGGAMAIFFIDLDDFKAVNDRHGHAVGDAVLAAFATRLAGEVRAGDLAARLSGDEFAVLLDGLSAAQAAPVAQALVQCVSSPYGLGDASLQVSASIGMAVYPEDGRTAAELLRAADAAMYQAKADGKRDFRRSGGSDLGPAAVPPRRPGETQAAGR